MEAVRRASRGMMGTAEASPQDSPSGVLEEEADDEEEQPLLRRQSRAIGQQQFEEARQEAAQQAAMDLGWFTWVLLFFGFCVLAFWFYVNIRSWYVLLEYYDTPCDQPLSQWLLVKLLLDVVSSSIQHQERAGDAPRPLIWLILGCQNAWLVMGFNWCSECKTCEVTNPELFSWVNFLVVFGTIVTIFLMLLPVLFYMLVIVVVHLIGTGRLKNNRAARDDTLGLLQQIEYSPDLFADSSDPNDARPAGDCCCCCEDFDAVKVIVRTPCQHYFHQECLGEWLKLAKTCPICRCDLDAATEECSIRKDVDLGEDLESGVLEGAGSSSSTGQPSRSSRQSAVNSSYMTRLSARP